MPKFSVEERTPSHVLRHGNQPIGPVVLKLDSGLPCTVIYCFSSKHAYDAFCAKSPLALTPYPLVAGYLRNQAGELGNGLQLLAIDPSGPQARSLHAAAANRVLVAMENQSAHVTAEYLLDFDQKAAAYRLATTSVEPVEQLTPGAVS